MCESFLDRPMSLIDSLFSLPTEMDQWIVLFYVALVLAGARIVEFVAMKHFERARDFAVRGFDYLAEEDQYRCPLDRGSREAFRFFPSLSGENLQ